MLDKLDEDSIAPRFSSSVSAISLSVGSMTHASVPSIVGLINKNGTREEWKNIWLAAVAVHCFAAIIFGTFGSADVQEWAKVDSKPGNSSTVKPTDIEDKESTL